MVIAIESYYRSCVGGSKCAPDADDQGGVVAMLHDEAGKAMPGGAHRGSSHKTSISRDIIHARIRYQLLNPS